MNFILEYGCLKHTALQTKGYVIMTNSQLKLIDKLGSKIHLSFSLWNSYLDQKQVLRVICSLAHVKLIKFDKVIFDFKSVKFIRKL